MNFFKIFGLNWEWREPAIDDRRWIESLLVRFFYFSCLDITLCCMLLSFCKCCMLLMLVNFILNCFMRFPTFVLGMERTSDCRRAKTLKAGENLELNGENQRGENLELLRRYLYFACPSFRFVWSPNYLEDTVSILVKRWRSCIFF